jgi:crossover junction endodeoxyribonuclease RuvC
MTLLALDLGTTTGYCVGTRGAQVSGTWNLKPSRFDGGGMRFVKFRARLDEIVSTFAIDMVVFEEVRRHAGTDAAHVYGGLMAILTEWCESHQIPYYGVPVGTIKRNWTGKGNANKQAMLAEAHRRGVVVADDNECDAIALFDLMAPKQVISDEPLSVSADRGGVSCSAQSGSSG